MNPNILRPYQVRAGHAWIEAMERGVQRGLIVMATGTGKNTVIATVLEEHAKNDPAFSGLVVAHQMELLEQTQATIQRQAPWLSTGLEIGDLKAERGTRVALATVQSIGTRGSSRLDWLAPRLVIPDEGHHGAAKTYQNTFRRFGCYEENGTFLLGFTATPHRLDQLALYGSDRAIFEEVVFVYSIVQAIRDGFLVDLRGYRAAASFDLSKVRVRNGDYVASDLERAVNTDAVNELAFKSWMEVAAERQTIVFCTGVDHAKDAALMWKAHGFKAEPVWGDMPKDVRKATLERFRKGETQVLTNMALLTEGFDAVACSCVVQLRPTQSWSLFTQMVGRGLRVLPDSIEGIGEASVRRASIKDSAKPDCIVIDIVSNTEAHSVDEKPEDGKTPSLQGLVGLPNALDMEGLTLAQAVDEFEKLPDFVKAAAFRRQTSFSGLTATLQQVEMLAELNLPPELDVESVKLSWLKVGDLEYRIDLGFEVGSMVKRVARLIGDVLGNWHLHYQSWDGTRLLREETESFEQVDAAEATFRAEQFIKRACPGVMRLGDRHAAWKKGAPTDEQVARLLALGVDPAVIAELDRGKASAMLMMMQEEWGK